MNTDVRGPKGELKLYRYLTLFIELGTVMCLRGIDPESRSTILGQILIQVNFKMDSL